MSHTCSLTWSTLQCPISMWTFSAVSKPFLDGIHSTLEVLVDILSPTFHSRLPSIMNSHALLIACLVSLIKLPLGFPSSASTMGSKKSSPSNLVLSSSISSLFCLPSTIHKLFVNPALACQSASTDQLDPSLSVHSSPNPLLIPSATGFSTPGL